MLKEAIAELDDVVRFYAENPVRYVEDIILRGVADNPRKEKIQPMQADILDLVMEHDRVALAAANGVGKDAVTAWLVEWYLVTHYLAKIPVVSPTGRQVKRTIFAEIASWSRDSLAADKLDVMLSSELRHRAAPDVWWAIGFSPAASDKDPTGKAEGIHAENLLYVITEAKAVPRSVWAAMERSCTRPGNKAFAQSVPGIEEGAFFDCFTIRARSWRTYSFPSAKQTEDGKYEPTTDLVSVESIERRLAAGESEPNFQAGVLARFIKSGSQSLFSVNDIAECMKAEHHAKLMEEDEKEKIDTEIGLDVARYGDDSTVLATKRGRCLLPLESVYGQDLMRITGLAMAKARELKPRTIRVDVIGIGSGVYDRLCELQQEEGKDALGGVILDAVNVSNKPSDVTKWVNKRDELWDTLADLVKRKEIGLPDDPLLMEELSTVRFRFLSSGQKKIEPKEDHKKRLGRSPDRADSVCLAHGGRFSPSDMGITF